ncbi:fibroin heavy chain-like [Cydia pomonella]|uniref:fibroin heavy chain-like n=1 Tax=Cydia pomonella TaxID=82600 RepID=UPI002ADE955A|nr:fibroin heavy chain-like [Cydia pomonella]
MELEPRRGARYLSMEKCSHRIHSPESFRQHIMAAKLIVVATALALCQATPVLYNGEFGKHHRRKVTIKLIQVPVNFKFQAYLKLENLDFISGFLYRDGRNFAISKAYSNNLGSQASGEAAVNDLVELYNAPAAPVYGSAKAVAEVQNSGAIFYTPAPATIVSYEQNFAPAEISYGAPAAQSAQSTASINGDSDSSIASASSIGAGSATSSARTQGIGSYRTSSNANTYGSGFGSASSNANSGVGSAITAARTQGNGFSSATSQADGGLANRATADAQSNGGYGSASSNANNAQGSAISSAKTQGYTGSAASDASVNTGYNNAISAAKVAPAPQKTIHWRFGTLYGTPSHINTRAQANANGFNAAKSTADVHQAGSAHSAANTYGSDGSANANANVNGGFGSANSEANTHGSGFAKSAANTQGSVYGSAQSQANTHGAGFGAAKSSANTGYGSANANADVNGAAGFAKSAANNGLGYGSAISSANSNGFGSARSDANTHGFGLAHANARVN